MEYLHLTTNSQVRREQLGGRSYLVAPMTLIVPGVLAGSKGPLYYPLQEIAANHEQWNGIPITLYHPTRNGQNVSAKYPGVIEESGMGFLRNARVDNKLVAEGWFDEELTKKVHEGVYNDLIAHRPIELSTGLYTNNVLADNGGNYNGRPYTHVATQYRADHLAILPDQQGACSLRDGCGVLVNSEHLCSNCGGKGGKKGPCALGTKGSVHTLYINNPDKANDMSAKAKTRQDHISASVTHRDAAVGLREAGKAAKAAFHFAQATYHMRTAATLNQGVSKMRKMTTNCGGKGGKPGPCQTASEKAAMASITAVNTTDGNMKSNHLKAAKAHMAAYEAHTAAASKHAVGSPANQEHRMTAAYHQNKASGHYGNADVDTRAAIPGTAAHTEQMMSAGIASLKPGKKAALQAEMAKAAKVGVRRKKPTTNHRVMTTRTY